jgi:peptide/nickel transport system permease protein
VLTFILRRVLLLIPVMLVVGIVVFALVHITPGDPAAAMLGVDSTSEDAELLRDRLGLNDPLSVQFLRWFTGVLRLDFGESIFMQIPVTTALLDRAQPTGLLTIYALLISTMLGIPAGVLAAVKRGSSLDRFFMLLSTTGAALPTFFLGILMILLFAVVLGWLPSGGFVEITEDPVGHVRTMIMPAVALGFAHAALLARIVRSSMLDTLREDYVRTAMAKGLRHRTVVMRHGLRNALIPTITIIGQSVGALLGGAIVVETVFNLPGMGRLVLQSVQRRDFPVIQGVVMTIAALYVLTNLLVDVLYVFVDPRIRFGGK